MEDFSEYLKLINNCDARDPLLTTTRLGKHMDLIPLHHVNPGVLVALCQALNLEQLIPTEEGLARDYRGLAELMGFKADEVETRFKKFHNPAKSLIDAYIGRRIQEGITHVTVNHLLAMIERLERFDIIDDMLPTLIQLASKRPQPAELAHKASDGCRQIAGPTNYQANPRTTNQHDRFDYHPLTLDDTRNDVVMYDAFVCFAPEDSHYAHELISLMERHGARIAVADLLLPGQFEFDALAQLIDSRCRKVIIVLTPNFSKSRECEFQTKYVSEMSIKVGSPKIIPVLYEACDDSLLPPMIKVISKIDLTNAGNNWQQKKLLRSLDLDHERPGQEARFVEPSYDPNQSLAKMKDNDLHDNKIPAIVFADESQTDMRTTSLSPIIDLPHSQSSGSLSSASNMNQNLSVGSSRVSAFGKSNTKALLKSIKQLMLGNQSSVESISSQAMLIRPTSPDYLDVNQTDRSTEQL